MSQISALAVVTAYVNMACTLDPLALISNHCCMMLNQAACAASSQQCRTRVYYQCTLSDSRRLTQFTYAAPHCQLATASLCMQWPCLRCAKRRLSSACLRRLTNCAAWHAACSCSSHWACGISRDSMPQPLRCLVCLASLLLASTQNSKNPHCTVPWHLANQLPSRQHVATVQHFACRAQTQTSS